MPYGFPSASSFIDVIDEDFSTSNGRLTPVLTGLGHSWEAIQGFRSEFRRSCLPSIDLFLEQRAEFQELGKAAMAASLLKLEGRTSLETTPRDTQLDRWFPSFFKLLYATPRPDWGLLTVVTFNYERTFEQSLLQAVMAAFGLDRVHAHFALEPIKVIHFYGSLGKLSDLEFGAGASPEIVKRASETIRVVGERPEDGAATRTHLSLQIAERVCFFGFGFDRTNLSRMQVVEQTRDDIQIFATAKGLGEVKRAEVLHGIFRDRKIMLSARGLGIIGFLEDVPAFQ